MRQSEKDSVMPVAFIADELKKLWDLKQAGALTEIEFAQQKARLLGEQPTTETTPEQPAPEANTPEQPTIEVSPEQITIEANPEQPAIKASPEQTKLKLDGASVYVPDSQAREVDASEPMPPPALDSAAEVTRSIASDATNADIVNKTGKQPTAPSPKVGSRPLVKCPECGAPTFDLAHHRHIESIPDRSYKLPTEKNRQIVTDVIEAPQPSPSSIPVPEQIVTPPEKVQKAKVGVGWLILKIVFWVFAFLGVLYIVAAIVSNSPTSTNSETKPAILSSSSSISSSSSASAVESLSANWLLAKQLDKHKETLKALTEANQRGDMGAFRRILNVRSAELARVIDEVNSGSYSVNDKQKLLVPLQQEKDWADNAIVGMSQ